MTILETVPNPGGKCAACRKKLPKTVWIIYRTVNRKVIYFCDPGCARTPAKGSRLPA